MSDFVPNSFSMPNAYVDRFWHLLTSKEKDVLVYIARRTYGFGKSSDAIGWEQFINGIVTEEGKRLDFGTGLTKPQLSEALNGLLRFGIVVIVRAAVKYPPKARRAAEYALQINCALINVAGLEQRKADKRESGKARLVNANREKANRKELELCGSYYEPHGEVSSDETYNLPVPNKKKSNSTSIEYRDLLNSSSLDSSSFFDDFDEGWSTSQSDVTNSRGEK